MATDPVHLAKRASATGRSRPGCRSCPSSLRILIHPLPERAQIDTQVTEQLIVEFYSKYTSG